MEKQLEPQIQPDEKTVYQPHVTIEMEETLPQIVIEEEEKTLEEKTVIDKKRQS